MLTRITGRLTEIDGLAGTIVPEPGAMAYEVLLPAFLAQRLGEHLGSMLTLHTLEYLESQGQGASFIPRLVGFESPQERRFFELFTTVKGIGNRKALRAMASSPALIARAIARRDACWLQELPEIGKRLAETVVAELHGKVEAFLSPDEERVLESKSSPSGGLADRAVSALMALGESKPDAQRMVARAIERQPSLESPDAVVSAAYASRDA